MSLVYMSVCYRITQTITVQSAKAVEYTDCVSAEG